MRIDGEKCRDYYRRLLLVKREFRREKFRRKFGKKSESYGVD
ncbi:MAG: hypothetical protein ACRDDY_13425 [Clostridium sp.]